MESFWKAFSNCNLLIWDSTLEIPSSCRATENNSPPQPHLALFHVVYAPAGDLRIFNFNLLWSRESHSICVSSVKVWGLAYPKFQIFLCTDNCSAISVTWILNSKLLWSNSFLQIPKKPHKNNPPSPKSVPDARKLAVSKKTCSFRYGSKRNLCKKLIIISSSPPPQQFLFLPVIVPDCNNPPQTVGAALIQRQLAWRHIWKNEKISFTHWTFSSLQKPLLSPAVTEFPQEAQATPEQSGSCKRVFQDAPGSWFPVENPGQESPRSEKEAGFNLFFWMVLHKRTFPLHPCLLCPFNLTCWQGAKEHNKKKLDLTWEAMTHLQMKCCMYCGTQEGHHPFNR